MAKWTKVDKKSATMSVLQGYVPTRYADIVAVLGEPHKRGDKVLAEWVIKFEGIGIATVYCWKCDVLPYGEYFWHIGGFGDFIVPLVGELLNAYAYAA